MLTEVSNYLKDLFNLTEGKAHEQTTISEIKQGVNFRGAQLWILIFAIMIASVGLNMNSSAVIIGAMLISPLMGPIMGIGLGVGINDFQLIVKAMKNLAVAVLISVLTSALYFWISPLHDAQSELLARTSPTLWDVLIGSFGGLAGIVAASRKEKSNAIPGVAIATALMPPLCTAGYGLATAQWQYFFGAFYLFFINSVFISLSTYLVVKVLRFKHKEFLDPLRERKVKRYIFIFAIATILPSIYTGIKVTRASIFERNVQHFINQEMQFDNTQVINHNMTYDANGSTIEITLYGTPISGEMITQLKTQLGQYSLADATLHVLQGYQDDESIDMATVELLNQQLKTGIIEDLYKKNQEQIKTRDDRIHILEEEILRYRSQEIPIADLVTELKTINSNVLELSVTKAVISHLDSLTSDTTFLAYASFRKQPPATELSELENWLKARIKTEQLRLVIGKNR